MQQDNVDNRRRAITRTFRKADAKETIERFVGKGKSLVQSGARQIENFISGKKRKPMSTPKKPVAPVVEDDKTMGNED